MADDNGGGSVGHLRAIALQPMERVMLQYIAQHGGQVPFQWEGREPQTAELVKSLINKRLVKEIEYVTDARQLRGNLCLRLTDDGRAALAKSEELERQASMAPKPVIVDGNGNPLGGQPR